MNILYVTNHLNIGGITRYVLTLAKGMKQRGHSVFIASSQGALLPNFIAEGVTCIPIPIKTKQEISFKVLRSFFALRAAVKKNKIDIVHSHSRTTQVLGCMVAYATGAHHISTCHGFFKKRFSRKAFPCWGEKTIAISESVGDHLVNDFGVREEDIVVVHSGVEVDRPQAATPLSNITNHGRDKLQAEAKKRFGLKEGPVVGVVARLSQEKGHSYLIEAMRMVVDVFPEAQLLIVGDGRLKEALVNLVQQLGLKRNVFFAHSVSNTQDAFCAMDIFVLPSLKEGLGLALMEAMGFGLCVAGSRVGGITSLIKDGDNGMLFEPADARQLAGIIKNLLSDKQKRDSLAKKAKECIVRNFSVKEMLQKTEEVYARCVGIKRKP